MQDSHSQDDERPSEELPESGAEVDGSASEPDAGEALNPAELDLPLGGEEEESDALTEEIREALEELDELRDRHLRLAAEFENYRKRTRRELSQAKERGRAELAERLLDALDDLERLSEAVEEEATEETLEEGILMLHRKLRKELGEAGLTRMQPEGEPFDPEVHEALLTTPTGDRGEDNLVSRVLINGYSFGERLLRPVRVEVKKYREEGEGGDDDADADAASDGS